MEWAEGWAAEEEASFSSFNDDKNSSMAASFDQEVTNEVDSTGLNARLNAVADELAYPQKHSSVRGVLRDGEELYEEGVQLWDQQERERAGTAFLRSINLCQEALGDALDSMEEEELEALIALSEKQLALAREHGWATHDDDTGAGLPPAGPHMANATGIDPFSPNGGSYEDDYDQEDFEGSENGYSDGDSPMSGGGIGFPITVSNSTGESGDDGYRDGGRGDEIPWPPSLNQERGSSRSGERSRSTEPRLQGGGMTLGDGWQLTMEGGTSAFDERAFDDRQRFDDRVAYQPHSMYDSLRSSPSRSSVGGHKANARAPFVYSDLSVVRMALGGPPPASASLPPALAMDGMRPAERPSGAPNGSRRRGMLPPQGPASPRGETEIAVAHATAHALERSVEDLCPELTTPRRRGWDPVHPKRGKGSHQPLQASTLRGPHGGSWSLPNYQTRDNLKHPRSAVNGFRVGTPSALGRSLPRRAVRSPVNMYAESRPWRNSISGGEMSVTDASFGSTGSSAGADNRPVLFTMADITRGAEAEARIKLQQRADKLRRIEAFNSPPRSQRSGGSGGGRQVSPQKQKAKMRLKQARENKARRDALERQRDEAEAEFRDAPRDNGSEPPEGSALDNDEQFMKVSKTGSFSVQWNDKLERTLVQEKAQKARFLMGAGLNEEEHMKVRVSPQMNYLSRLSDNAKRSYDEDACSVNPPPSVHGAVALTDTGKHSGNAKGSAKKEAAAAYAEKIQEIMARAREQNQSPRSDAPGSPKAQPRAESVVLLTMTESSSLLERHPGAAEQGGAFARIEEPERSMAMVNRSTLLQDWLSEDVKQKAGSSGWNGWRPAKEMIGEIVQRWEWDQGVWLLKIAGQQSGPGEGDVVDRYCCMPRTACASVKVLGIRSLSVDWGSGDDSDEEEDEEQEEEEPFVDETDDSKRAIEPVPHQ